MKIKEKEETSPDDRVGFDEGVSPELCEWLRDIAAKDMYDKMNGVDSLDIGSKALLLKLILPWAKKKGYKMAGFRKLKVKQLKEILKRVD